MATKAQIKAFIETVAPLAIDVCNSKQRKILPSVCIAMGCNESGYGTSAKMINANAIFGIKVGKSKAHFGTAWKDKAYSTKTKECYDGKTFTEITDMFRAYDSLRDSVEDYYDMLGTSSRYKDCVGVTDAEKCITAIIKGGYATDPNYVSKIMTIIKTNNLTQYDECMKGTSNKKEDVPAADDNSDGIFSLGQKVKVTAFFSNAYANGKRVNNTKTGVITKIKSGSNIKHPYLISINNVAIGWTEEQYMSATSFSNIATATYHTVASGDTNSKIAKKYGTTVSEILRLNKTTYPSIKANFIRVGWKLRVK